MDLVKLPTKYDAKIYQFPFWEGGTVFDETVYPLENKDGSLPDFPLMYYADQILKVCSSDLETCFAEGEDFICKDGKLSVLPKGRIPTVPFSEYYFDEEKEGACRPLKEGGFSLHSEGVEFRKYQICVTYRHSDTWQGPVPKKKGKLLPLLQERLSKKMPLKAVFFGDSITWGANSSAQSDAKPFIPRWADMFPLEIKRKFNCPIDVINTAVGGKTSLWGKDVVHEAVVFHHPDLAVIGFGMNDGTNQISPEVYEENIRYMIDEIRKDRPDSTIIVLNCILPNKEMVRYCDGIQEAYTPILQKIEDDYKEIAFTDIMELHKFLLSRKKYADMTGNNINHVSDFLSRLYSQALFRTIQE